MKTGNFSGIYEAEDILLEDKPLKTKKSKTPLEKPTDPNMCMIMEEFKDFDFTRSIPEGVKLEHVKKVQENSRKLEDSLAGIDIEKLVETQKPDSDSDLLLQEEEEEEEEGDRE